MIALAQREDPSFPNRNAERQAMTLWSGVHPMFCERMAMFWVMLLIEIEPEFNL
jgi:hypothetical protein